MAVRVKSPCLSAFLLPNGAPDPGAPPCMRQRFLPLTAGDLQGPPARVLAPQRKLESIGPVLRLRSRVISVANFRALELICALCLHQCAALP